MRMIKTSISSVVEYKRFLSFIQSNWASYDANQLTRETFMAALAKVDAILIRATYHTHMAYATLRGLSLDTAVPQNTGQGVATWLEDCTCPPEYTGLSCQVGLLCLSIITGTASVCYEISRRGTPSYKTWKRGDLQRADIALSPKQEYHGVAHKKTCYRPST